MFLAAARFVNLRQVARVGSALILMAAFSVESFTLPLQLRNGGYEALVRDVEARVSNVSADIFRLDRKAA